MTDVRALECLEERLPVQAGDGEDHDTGVIIGYHFEGDTGIATVAWNSGVTTVCDASSLRDA